MVDARIAAVSAMAAVAWLIGFDSVALGDGGSFSKHVVVAQEGNAADVGRDVAARRGQRDRRGGGDRLRPGGDPAGGRQPGRRRVHRRLPGRDRREVVTIDFRETARRRSRRRGCTSDAEGKLRPAPRRGAGGRRAGDGPGPGPGPRAVRASRRGPTSSAPPPAGREGFPISADWPASLNAQLSARDGRARAARDDLGAATDRLADFPESVAAFRKPDGTPWKAGDRLVQPDLAATLERIADGGPDEFYTGKTAELIARVHGRARRPDHPRRPRRLPGQGAAAGPRRRSAASRSTAWARPSSGGIVALPDAQHPRALRPQGRRPRVAPHPASRDRGDAPGASSPGPRELADPDFVDVAVAELISKAARRRAGRHDHRPRHAERRARPVPDPGRRGEPHDAPLDDRRRRATPWR